MGLLENGNGKNGILTVVFVSIFLVSLGMISHNAFAHGAAPSTCPNRYDGPIVSFIINNGSQTFDAIANPGVTFDVKRGSHYNVTFTIHTPSQSSQKNTDQGTTWYSDSAFGYGNGHCVYGGTTPSIGPDQDVSVNATFGSHCTACSGTQSVYFYTFANNVTINVHWIPVPGAPEDLSANGTSSSQIELRWNPPSSFSPATSYNIYRSTNSGAETFLATAGNAPSYNDTAVTDGIVYYYKVTAVNSYGESPQSNEASARSPPPGESYLAVKTVDPKNDQISDYHTILSQNGNAVATGYSPSDFTINDGQAYTVEVGDIGNFVFDHWQGTNSTNRDMTVRSDASTSLTLTAVYKMKNLPSTIGVGGYPQGVAVNPSTNLIYVVNTDSNTVSAIDGSTDAVQASIPVGDSPFSVAVNPNTDMIYAVNIPQNTAPFLESVSVIDGRTNKVVDTIQVGTRENGGGGGVAANPNTNLIYVVNDGSVSVIDGSTNTVKTSIPVGKAPSYVAVNPNTNKVYVTNAGSATVSVIDGMTNSVVDTIPVGNGAGDIGINLLTNKIYVTGYQLSVIDGSTNSVVSTINITPYHLGVNSNTNMVYASNLLANTVTIINGQTNHVVFNFRVGQYPAGVAVNPNTNTAYVANEFDNTISKVDASSPAVSIAPSDPQSLQATGGSAKVGLSWSAPSSNGGSAITIYKVYRSASSGSEAFLASTGNVTSYTDNTVTNGQTYFYEVTAVNSAGESPKSNEVSATPATPSDSGSTSGIVLNNVQSISGNTSSSNQMTLSNFNTGAGTNQLLIVGISTNSNSAASVAFSGTPLTRAVSSFNNNDAEFWYLKNPAGTGDITVTMNGQTQAVVGAYSFSGVNQTVPIPAHLAKHNTTPSSPNISITTKYANDWVLDLPSIYGGENLGSPTCTQQWNVNVPNAITGASSSMVAPSPATVTCSWTASSADLWDDVAVEIGSHTASGTSTDTTTTAPSAPTGLTATPGNAQVTLSWTASATNGGSAITNYKVYRSTSSGTETLLTKIGNVTSYNDTTVTNNRTYFYKVTTVNSVGESQQSNEANATPSASDYTIISTIPLGRGPTGIGVNPNTNMIYVAANGAATSVGPVIVIDGNTNSVTDHITVGSDTQGVGVNPITDRIYVAHSGNETVDVIDDTTNSVVSKISNKTAFVGVGVNPNTNMIYVSGGYSNDANGTISVIDGTTNKIVNIVSAGHYVAGVGVNPNTNMIYVANQGYFVRGQFLLDNTVFVIDGTTNSVVGTIHVGTNPVGVGVNPNTNMIYVANAKDNTVSVINGTTNSVIATIPVGSFPDDMGINPNTNKIYVGNAEGNSVSVIDGKTNSVVGTIPDGGTPTAVAVNPTTNKIYVANDDQTVSVIDGSSSGTSSTATHPSAPQNLESTAGNSQVSLSWAMPSSNGGSPITNYKVYRGISSDYEIFLATAGNVTSYNDNAVTNSQAYYYRVTAVNSAGESPMSNEAGAIPAAPSGSGSTSGIVLNNVQSTSGTTDSSNQITLSNFSATAGADRLLVVGVSANSNNVESITFAGTPLTRAVSHFTNNDAEFWYLTNSTGTGDITVTMNGPTQAVVGAYSFSGVNQTVPIPTHITRHNLSPSSPAISITTSHPNDWVLDLPSIWGGVILGSPTCTQQWNVSVPGQITGASSSTVVSSPATVACSWAASSDNMWDDAAIEIGVTG